MRVISGTRRGHKLKVPKGIDVRPTEDRIKESLFNILKNIKNDGIALDLFGGSGSIGIEFLSRGAKKCYFVDISPQSISIIEENLIHTKLMDKAIILKKDGIKAVEYFSRENLKFDYIYIDPPFKEHNLLIRVLKSIMENEILFKDGIVMIEHENELVLEDEIFVLKKTDYRKYGSKSISFYKRT